MHGVSHHRTEGVDVEFILQVGHGEMAKEVLFKGYDLALDRQEDDVARAFLCLRSSNTKRDGGIFQIRPTQDIWRASSMKRVLFRAVILALLVHGVGPAQADYFYTTLDVPGASSSEASGINNAGQIVGGFVTGSRFGPSHGFLLSGGGYTQLDIPGTVSGTSPSGINAYGQVVGTYGGLLGYGFLLSGGNYTLLNVPASFGLAVKGTQGYGLNDSGQIVGGYTSLDFNHSLISGSFLLSQGNYTQLNLINNGSASSINNAGQIVLSNGTQSGVLSGNMLTAISVPGSARTEASGINNLGQIVGIRNDTAMGSPDHGFVYHDGMYTTFDVPGALNTDPFGINDLGQIVGSYTDAAGNEHGFLATPTAGPSTLVLSGIGVLGILGFAWRKLRALTRVSG